MQVMPLATILTPTYNRATLLVRCYQSLLRQTNKNFDWMVIDDGSTDDTNKIVKGFQQEHKIKIRYIQKANGGKHTALNLGIKQIQSDLTFIVDSDDYLSDDAVETIYRYYKKYKDHNGLCGFSFLRMHPDGKLYCKALPKDEFIESFIECRINRHIGGDMAEVFYTQCLMKYPFPEFSGEKFIGEDVVWIKMALNYKLVFINKPVYYADYLEGGLTHSGKTMRIKSPLGAMERAKMLMTKQCILSNRIKGILLYVCYGKFANKTFNYLYHNCEYILLLLSFYPFGVILHSLWKRKYMKG